MALRHRIAGGAAVTCAIGSVIAIVLSHGQIRTNEAGLRLIGNAEGCRMQPYYCPAGVITDGVGNTHNVHSGKTIEQISDDWQRNIQIAEKCVNTYFRGEDMTDNAFSAMTSAAFNLGCNGLRFYGNPPRETTIHKMAIAGRWTEMCNRLTDFDKSGGVRLAGLTKRREAERELCLR